MGGEGECGGGASMKGPYHSAVGVQNQTWVGAVPTDKGGLQVTFGMRFEKILNCLYLNMYLDDY